MRLTSSVFHISGLQNPPKDSRAEEKGDYGSVILMACTGHWISQALQKMQSFSRAGSAFHVANGAFPLSLVTPLSIFSCSPGNSILSKTFTGQTVMQIPSAMQMSKSTPTADP